MSTVAIQGVKGSYSEEATIQLIGGNADIVECLDFSETFDAVVSRRAEYAVVPVANKIVGEIEGTMERLRGNAFRIYERMPLKVMHVLAGTAHAEIGSIRTVRSHVEALKQCKRFLNANGHWTQIIGADTASSIRRVIDEDVSSNAAIGSRRATEIYGAKILAENIADDHDNWTTFWLIGRSETHS
jgi:Prephenate dehydratase